LADASHELRTPVTALLGNVEYAVRHGAEPEVLEDLRQDATRLARLVDSLLALERAAQNAAPESQPVALDELVRAVVAEQDGGRVGLGEVVAVRVAGDPEALRRVVANLVENGLVHGPAGGRVTLSVRAQDGTALLSVLDTGTGPDPGQRDRMFERFWRGSGAAGRPGAGLGLSIVAAIVEGHHGTIEVDGAEFRVRLPALDTTQ
jgi:two-component system OmpR family sensor kinase